MYTFFLRTLNLTIYIGRQHSRFQHIRYLDLVGALFIQSMALAISLYCLPDYHEC